MGGLTTTGLIAACLIILVGIVINKVWSDWNIKRNNKRNGSSGNPESPMREDCRTMFFDIKTELSQIQTNTLLYGEKFDDIKERLTKIEGKLE